MDYRKSSFGLFLVCMSLFSGYVIRCDSLKSFQNEKLHDLSHDINRTSVPSTMVCVCVCVYNIEADTESDVYIEPDLLVQVDFKQSELLLLYRHISLLIGQHASLGFSSRTENLKTKQNQDSVSGQTEIESTLGWIHGKRKMIRMSIESADEITNHSNSFSVDNGTLQNVQRPYHNFDYGTLELKTGMKLSIVLFYILTRIFLKIFLNAQRYFNQKGITSVKGNAPNNAYHRNLLKYYLELCYPSVDQHHSRKNNTPVTAESCHLTKKVLNDTMSTLSPPPQHIVVAPVTELNDYFESMNHLDTSSLDVSLNIEILRIESFRNFPRSVPISTIRLAENGFFYTGESDEVECFHCHIRYSGWNKGDKPSDIHKDISPNCDFVRGMETSNVSLLQSPRPNSNKEDGMTYEHICTGPPELPEEIKARDCQFRCKASSKELKSNTGSLESQSISSAYSNTIANGYHSNASVRVSQSNTDDRESHISNGAHRNQTYEGSAILEIEASSYDRRVRENNKHQITSQAKEVKMPHLDTNSNKQNDWRTRYSGKLRLTPLAYVRKTMMYPAYAIPTIRLSSYKGWSSTSGHMPKSLSDAGFIYAGYGDLVRCFCCGGALRNWLPGDDPWVEHARWFPECVYLRQSKGDNFIILVHDDVKLPQVICHNSNVTPRSVTRETGYTHSSPVPEHTGEIFHGPVSRRVEEPISRRVQEMGFSIDAISSTVTSLQRQGKPIDVYNIVNEILCSETIPQRVGFDEVDGSGKRQQQTIQENTRQVHGEETRVLETNEKCKICLADDACVIFLPCHHVVSCEECGPVMHKCPVCRQVIKNRLKIR